MPPTPAIRARGLTKTYPPSVQAVRGVDLDVQPGECFGLLGPNGAGKTTSVEIFEGLLEPTSGVVEIFGLDWARHERELRQRIGVSLQETRLPDKATVGETVRLFRSFYRDGLEPEAAIREVDLEAESDVWVGRLSGGQKRRLDIACAIVGDPELLFLDEPTTGLDPLARRRLWDVVRRLRAEGRTVLLTTHYMDEAQQLADRVAVIDHGRIIALDSPDGLIATLGGDVMLEIAHDGELSDAEWRAAVPDVRETRRDGDQVCLTVTHAHEAVPAVLAELDRRGLALRSLSTRRATLEDVFLKLTGRRLDDAEAGEDAA